MADSSEGCADREACKMHFVERMRILFLCLVGHFSYLVYVGNFRKSLPSITVSTIEIMIIGKEFHNRHAYPNNNSG